MGNCLFISLIEKWKAGEVRVSNQEGAVEMVEWSRDEPWGKSAA
jgi:hypothetical protein